MSGTDRGGDRQGPATWAEVEAAQAEAVLAATPAQRLAWLEDAMQLAARARRDKPAAEPPPGGSGGADEDAG